MKTAWIAAVLTTSLVSAADAGPLHDALAKSDVAGLRAQLPEPGAKCTLAAVYAKKGDLTRAALFMEGCVDQTLPEDVSADVARASRELKKKLRESELSQLSIVTNPAGLTVELDTLAGETLVTPTMVWVKAGAHTVKTTTGTQQLSSTANVQAFARGAVFIDASAALANKGSPKDGKLDFNEDNALEKNDGPPPDVKRGSMINKKLLGVVEPRTGEEIADPLATQAAPARLPMWLGVRLGGGMFDDGAADAKVRPAFGAAARYELGGPAFLAARIDWSRRGGAGDAAVDVLGASAGAGYSVVDADAISVALIGQLRGDLRFGETRNAMSVNRGGASAAAAVEVAFPATPLTAGVRFEQGLTELVPGFRDRALLLELGVDWR